MKKHSKFGLFILMAFWGFSAVAQTNRSYSVLTWATTTSSPASITIHFEDDALATGYQIFRKEFGTSGWGSQITSMTGGGTGNLSYKDNNVTEGTSYEYQVYKIGSGGFNGFGYLNAGVNVGVVHNRGTLLLIIEKEASDSLSDALETLRDDLSGDGYRVIDYVVDKSTNHENVKAEIETRKKLYTDLNTLYIFGHVEVPYSGKYCNDFNYVSPPDGHRAGVGDHCGAWAADVYYAIPEGTWTDNDTVDYGASKSWNKNAVGDGKYDQIMLPGKVEYQLGRVDLSNLPAFSMTEFGLLKQYIQKNHDYKHAIVKPLKRSIIDENFGNSFEAFGSNGYRNFAAMVGQENIVIDDYMTKLKDSTYLWAYGAGGGTFTSAGGIGNTANFASNQGAATFNFIFGSFFGDWDNSNAFLRAPLAVKNGGLTNAWAGRPWWHAHPMAFNQTIGYCTQLVQNNVGEYERRYFFNNIHIALMGDPTLRMHMFEPVSDLTSEINAEKTEVTLSWTASTANVDGYNVYISRTRHGEYTKVNSTLITSNQFKHTAAGNGTFSYMVRAQRLEETLSGTFQNLSQGIMLKVDNLVNLSVDDVSIVSNTLIYPNPSTGLFNIRFDNESGSTELKVYDIKGQLAYNEIIIGYGTQIASINLEHLNSGIYFVSLNGNTSRLVIK